MRRAARLDANHGEIKEAFAKLGFEVFDASRVGGGFPDLVVFHRATQRLMLVEVKTPTGRHKTTQERFREKFPVLVARTVEDAIAVVSGREA